LTQFVIFHYPLYPDFLKLFSFLKNQAQ